MFEDFRSFEFVPLLHNHWSYRQTYGKRSGCLAVHWLLTVHQLVMVSVSLKEPATQQ